MALTLPTELIQTILLATNPAQDTATYYSARLTCHRWYKAASTPFHPPRSHIANTGNSANTTASATLVDRMGLEYL